MNMIKKDINNKKKRPETDRLKFIDSYRFMASGLGNLVNDLVKKKKKKKRCLFELPIPLDKTHY